MKKFLALVVSLVMVMAIGTIALPVNAVEETENFTRDEIIKMAQVAFPEYAEKMSEIVPVQADDLRSIDPVVIDETRELSEDISVKYQEFESGRAFIFIINCGKANVRRNPATGYTDYYVDFHATCSFSSQSFRINNFLHRCSDTMVDSIVKRGELAGEVTFYAYDTCILQESGGRCESNYIANFAVSITDTNGNPMENIYPAYITVTVRDGNSSISGY